jgi:hypothetical protein
LPEAAARPDRGRGWRRCSRGAAGPRGACVGAQPADPRRIGGRARPGRQRPTGFRSLSGLRPSLLAAPVAGEPWPEPHDLRFDFAGTAAGAGWIDELAARARLRLAASRGEIFIAHSDWPAEHLRFEDAQIVSATTGRVSPWGREPALLGAAAHAFTADWGVPQARRLPTLDESRAFVADYEAARGARFSQVERETIDAAWVYATAYGARCEHSDAQLGLPWAEPQVSDDSYRGLLADHGHQLLA